MIQAFAGIIPVAIVTVAVILAVQWLQLWGG